MEQTAAERVGISESAEGSALAVSGAARASGYRCAHRSGGCKTPACSATVFLSFYWFVSHARLSCSFFFLTPRKVTYEYT